MSISRRSFLKCMTGAGVAVTVPSVLFWKMVVFQFEEP